MLDVALMFQVTDYLHSVFAKRKSPNKLKVTMVIGAKPWLADTQHALYEAGKAAVKRGTTLTLWRLRPETLSEESFNRDHKFIIKHQNIPG